MSASASGDGARIGPQPWMAAPDTQRVLAALTGGGMEARFIGGCVRDAAIGRRVRDIDLATPLSPEMVMDRLAAAGLKVVPTGVAHGTVTAVSGGRPFEITTLRRDVETDGRRAVVAFTDDWRADAARRDFTMNALSCRADGTLFDYFGGLADLHAGQVRFVGDPMARITEDVLRLLRFYRFVAHYGRGAPDGTARAACRVMADKLRTLSAERVREETIRLLQAPAPHGVLATMREDGVIAAYLPEATDLERLGRLVALESSVLDAAHSVDAMRRLAALLTPGADPRALAVRLRFSNREQSRLVALHAAEPAIGETASDTVLRRLCYRLGAETVRDRALLAWAAPAASDLESLSRVLNTVRGWRPISLPVGGDDVLALGVAPGQSVGAALSSVEKWWIAADFRPGRKEALAKLREDADSLSGKR